MKWKSRGRAHTDTSVSYNFLHFSQQYTVHIMARREKNRAGFFSCARVRIMSNEFSPGNICLYIIAAAQDRRGGSNWLQVYLGLRWTQTWLKSAQMARHGYDAICAHNLFDVYHMDKLSTDNRTLFYDGKMCECTQISHEKCDDVREYSYEKCEWCWLWW